MEAQELLARLALEDNDPAKAAEEADKALDMSPQRVEAMAILATIDWLDDKDTDDRILGSARRRRPTRPRRASSSSTAATKKASGSTARRSTRSRTCGARARSWAST